MVRELAERREQSALEFIAKSSRVASALRAFRLLAIVASFAVFAAAQIEELTAYEQSFAESPRRRVHTAPVLTSFLNTPLFPSTPSKASPNTPPASPPVRPRSS